ncbi:MAG: hypothetical protein M5U25_05770 [Planctomycetota bacterium]|nr:hypothetical protein [Planctomycetota bacterium]
MQPPPGYPQGQPQPPQQPQQPYPPGYAQPGQAPYGMQQYPYHPPRKQGMPGWAWALIIMAVLFIGLPMILGILAVIAAPAITTNTRDARRAEGEQLLGSARDYLRVEFAKTNRDRDAFMAFMLKASSGDFDGIYYTVDRTPGQARRPGYDAEVSCSPTEKAHDPSRGFMVFRWQDGSSQTEWR